MVISGRRLPRKCTSGGVYVLCIYSHARSSLFCSCYFVVLFVLLLSNVNQPPSVPIFQDFRVNTSVITKQLQVHNQSIDHYDTKIHIVKTRITKLGVEADCTLI